MYLCRPYMGVGNLPPWPGVGDKLRVHKVPLPSIFPPLQDRKADMNTP